MIIFVELRVRLVWCVAMCSPFLHYIHTCRPLYNINFDAQDIVNRTARKMGRLPVDARVEDEKPRRKRSSPHVASPTWEQKPATEVRKHRAPPHQRFSMSLRWMIKKKKLADMKLKGDDVEHSSRMRSGQGESKSLAQKQKLQQQRRRQQKPQQRRHQPQKQTRRAVISPGIPNSDVVSLPQQSPPCLVTLKPAPTGDTIGMATVAKMKAHSGERAFVAKADAEITPEKKASVQQMHVHPENGAGAAKEQAATLASSPTLATGAAPSEMPVEDAEPEWTNLSSELASLQAELRSL